MGMETAAMELGPNAADNRHFQVVTGVEEISAENSRELPPGFRILSDRSGREVLLDERDDERASVFETYDEAADVAWCYWREIYKPDLPSHEDVRGILGQPPAQHEAYAALRTALIGSGVLTMEQCEAWAARIVAQTQGER